MPLIVATDYTVVQSDGSIVVVTNGLPKLLVKGGKLLTTCCCFQWYRDYDLSCTRGLTNRWIATGAAALAATCTHPAPADDPDGIVYKEFIDADTMRLWLNKVPCAGIPAYTTANAYAVDCSYVDTLSTPNVAEQDLVLDHCGPCIECPTCHAGTWPASLTASLAFTCPPGTAPLAWAGTCPLGGAYAMPLTASVPLTLEDPACQWSGGVDFAFCNDPTASCAYGGLPYFFWGSYYVYVSWNGTGWWVTWVAYWRVCSGGVWWYGTPAGAPGATLNPLVSKELIATPPDVCNPTGTVAWAASEIDNLATSLSIVIS